MSIHTCVLSTCKLCHVLNPYASYETRLYVIYISCASDGNLMHQVMTSPFLATALYWSAVEGTRNSFDRSPNKMKIKCRLSRIVCVDMVRGQLYYIRFVVCIQWPCEWPIVLPNYWANCLQDLSYRSLW